MWKIGLSVSDKVLEGAGFYEECRDAGIGAITRSKVSFY